MSKSRHQTTVACQLRIQLRGISPPVWRRLLISMTSTILDLHEAIQAVMSWEDIHLNQFTIRGQRHEVVYRTVFGTMRVNSPRLYHCPACQDKRTSFSPLAQCLPG